MERERAPIFGATTSGLMGGILLFILQAVLHGQGQTGPPTGVAFAQTVLHLGGQTAGVVGLLLFAAAGGAWGYLFAVLLRRVNLLTGLLFGLLPWLVAMLVMMPILGQPLFAGGEPRPILIALGMNLLWGAFVGLATPVMRGPADPLDLHLTDTA